MRKLSLLLVVLVLAGCSSGLLAPDAVRQAEFIEKTKVKRGTAYHQALRWFDKNLRFVSGAARVQDQDAGHMRMEAAYACNLLRKDSDLKEYYLTFELDFDANPGFISLHFTQLRMETPEGLLVPKPETQLSSPENVDRIRPCLKKMVAAIAKAVESNTLTW